MADDSSAAEINAMEAERVWRDVKICEYMAEHIGEEFEGFISTVTSFGLFIELPNTINGLIRVSDLDDDYYIYDEIQLLLNRAQDEAGYILSVRNEGAPCA